MIETLFLLLCGHALADFGLQSPGIATGKNRHNSPPGYDPKVHGPMQTTWPYYLVSHGLIHGLMVAAIIDWRIGVLEAVCHTLIDFLKCERLYGIHVDQGFHFLTKIIWLAI